MKNLLKELYEKKITEDQAWDIFNDIVDEFHDGLIKKDPFVEAMLDKYEATANAHGADFNVIAKWRYEGWPTICYKCKKPLDYKEFGWSAKDNKLKHLVCP
jgi:protein-disulfide isomerase-like protein with CxxC motif